MGAGEALPDQHPDAPEALCLTSASPGPTAEKVSSNIALLEEYIDRMKEGQNDIYCITDESIAAVSSLLLLESPPNSCLEIPHMVDPIDESFIQLLKVLDSKKSKSVMECLGRFVEITEVMDDYNKIYDSPASA